MRKTKEEKRAIRLEGKTKARVRKRNRINVSDKKLIKAAAYEAMGAGKPRRRMITKTLPKGLRCIAWYWDGAKIRQCLKKTVTQGYCKEHLTKG
jgi:hypothetical protein